MSPPGLAIERTRLAWDRTALSVAAFAALLVKVGVGHSRPLYSAAGVVGLIGALAVGAAGRARIGRRTRGAVWLAITATGGITGLTMALALFALFL